MTPAGVWTTSQKTWRYESEFNYASIASFHKDKYFLYWHSSTNFDSGSWFLDIISRATLYAKILSTTIFVWLHLFFYHDIALQENGYLPTQKSVKRNCKNVERGYPNTWDIALGYTLTFLDAHNSTSGNVKGYLDAISRASGYPLFFLKKIFSHRHYLPTCITIHLIIFFNFLLFCSCCVQTNICKNSNHEDTLSSK